LYYLGLLSLLVGATRSAGGGTYSHPVGRACDSFTALRITEYVGKLLTRSKVCELYITCKIYQYVGTFDILGGKVMSGFQIKKERNMR